MSLRSSTSTLSTMSGLGQMYLNWGKYAEAEPLFKQGLEIAKRVLGPEHPRTMSATDNVAQLYRRQGRYAEAESLFSQALEMSKHRCRVPSTPTHSRSCSTWRRCTKPKPNMLRLSRSFGRDLKFRSACWVRSTVGRSI